MAVIQSLSEHEAFLAMYAFLEARPRSETLGALLRGLAVSDDGRPADSVVALDWQNACRAARTGQVNTSQASKK
jgi:hypothetical protein